MSHKKLSNSEKQQLKNRLKKFGLISFVVISSILNILFVVSLCVGCANTKKADAFNYQGVVTTPIVQTYNAPSGYRVNATSLNNNLPSNYQIYLDYPNYNTGDNFLPYVYQFIGSLESYSSGSVFTETYFVPLHDFRDNSYDLRLYVYWNQNGEPINVSLEIRKNISTNVGSIIGVYTYNRNSPMIILDNSLFQELLYYNSYIEYSLVGVKQQITLNGVTSNVVDITSDYTNRFLSLVRSVWYYFSTDTWKGSIHLTSDSVLSANNYTLKNLKYEGLVGEDKHLSSVSVSSQGVISTKYYYATEGSYYYKGELYHSLVFFYEKVYKGDDSPYELYTGDLNGSNIENSKLLYKCNDSSYNNLYYLSRVALCNTPYNDPYDYLNSNYQLVLFNVCYNEFTWLSMDYHYIYINLMSSISQPMSSNPDYMAWGGVGRDIDFVFGYLYDDGFNNNYSFIQYITNSYVIPVIVDPDNYSTEDLFAQTYSWINFIILSFIPLMSVSILPGVTLGVFIIMPIVLGLVLIIVRLFKR